MVATLGGMMATTPMRAMMDRIATFGRAPVLAAVLLTACAAMLGSVEAAPFTGWRSGDLIFQESRGSQSAAVLAATGSRFTHMGIVQIRGRTVTVIEAGAMVGETPLGRFVARGAGGRYAVYRIRGLKVIQWAVAQMAARMMYGKPYDLFFREGNDRIYCSELPVLAFKSAGIDLGRRERLGQLALNNAAVRQIFLQRWRLHPDCRGLDERACWARIQNQRLVTPLSIARDPDVVRVYSNF
jgi:hypothetical protein